MTTKKTKWDIRRRHHGEVIEKLVLKDLCDENVIEPIPKWDGIIRQKFDDRPFFLSKDGTSECLLDEFGWVNSYDFSEMRSCIIEVKAMRSLDWTDWVDHAVLHVDKLEQHARHRRIAHVYGFDGVAIIAYNKDSSEIFIRVYDCNDNIIQGFVYRY